MDRLKIYDILYALIARDERETALFGGCGPRVREAFARSLATAAFVKLRWRTGKPADAKAYLLARVESAASER